VARDRKRAKQRRGRGGAAAGRNAKAGQAPAPSQPVRADVPGSLDHASGEVDEFDAALVAGAGGVPVAPDTIDTGGAADTLSEREIEAEALAEGDITQDMLQEAGGSGGGGAAPPAAGGGSGGGPGDVTPERASGAPLRGGNRAIGFLRASWAELQRVQWPDRRQVTQATAVVLGFVAIAGAYLGLADVVAKEIVEAIL
jgi:preprotein translocase subunit SecE